MKRNKNDVEVVQLESDDDAYKKVPVDVTTDLILSQKCPSVSAAYHDRSLELPENAENPLILAIPPFESREQFKDAMKLSFAVHHSDEMRKLPTQLRLLGIERISRVLVLTDAHLTLLDWIHISLRRRYRGLIPLRSLKRIAQDNYEATQTGKTKAIYTQIESHADCISLLGISGAGKTTTVKMVLSMFPMIIEHTEFNGVKARFTQVVWIMVSCPPNGSVLTLMKGILHWFDENLGTSYVKEVKARSNTGDFVEAVIDKLKLHHVGMLVIDEIQFAIESAERADLMGFLTSLLNDGKCLFVLVGTPDAGQLIKKTIRNLRRVVSRTFIQLEHFPAIEDARRLANSIVAIDFLPERADDLEEVVTTLIEVGAGSPAFMKLAWEHTQYMGEKAKKRKVTAALVRIAVKRAFSLVEGLLEALRKKDMVALDQYRDTAVEQMVSMREKFSLERKRRNLNLDAETDEALVKFSKGVGALINLGWSEIKAEAFVRSRMIANASITVADLVRLALQNEIESS
jgi:hypothetical protein